jgi:hypothetical protein
MCWQSANTSMLATACMATLRTWKGKGCSPAAAYHTSTAFISVQPPNPGPAMNTPATWHTCTRACINAVFQLILPSSSSCVLTGRQFVLAMLTAGHCSQCWQQLGDAWGCSCDQAPESMRQPEDQHCKGPVRLVALTAGDVLPPVGSNTQLLSSCSSNSSVGAVGNSNSRRCAEAILCCLRVQAIGRHRPSSRLL